MKLLGLSLQIHKWIGLVVGLQVLFWTVGGLVMTAIPIERVRSEHHLRKLSPPPLTADLLGVGDALRRSGVTAPVSAQLKSAPRGPVWVVEGREGEPRTLDARAGSPVAPLTAAQARRLAAAAYVGRGRPVGSRYFAEAPQETGREGPLWRVDFDDAERTSFYLSPDTGEVVTRRSQVWRFYDFFWRLHILDFKTGENFNHPLIIVLAALTLPMVFTGFILLWIRLGRDLARSLRRARPRPLQAGQR
ncbi:MAG TPA: PepSY domain-containing protein [Caulobacteraceae bacterium]|jgi:antitoxin (DNA-binding transcriptional repressor) of toxin-antitoxin stability system